MSDSTRVWLHLGVLCPWTLNIFLPHWTFKYQNKSLIFCNSACSFKQTPQFGNRWWSPLSRFVPAASLGGSCPNERSNSGSWTDARTAWNTIYCHTDYKFTQRFPFFCNILLTKVQGVDLPPHQPSLLIAANAVIIGFIDCNLLSTIQYTFTISSTFLHYLLSLPYFR